MEKIAVGVLFGGRSPEHEVSIITGIQVLHALKKSKYDVLPIYITKEGQWVLGNESFFNPETFKDIQKAIQGQAEIFLPPDFKLSSLVSKTSHIGLFNSLKKLHVDVFFPAFHGRYGEDGAIQGVFEMAGIAYVGCDVEASAIGMDKVISKKIAESLGIPVLKSSWFLKPEWSKSATFSMAQVFKDLRFPLFVKPSRLGSSIGIKRVRTKKELNEAMNVAFFYDTKVMVEECLSDAKEVNISLMGNNPYEVSACEQPIASKKVLSFQDKYLSQKGPSKGMASAKRVVPAPIKKKTKSIIENFSKSFFAEIGGEGIARVDYLISDDEKQIYFNEINIMPGSVSFYLWKEVGVKFDKLVDKLIQLALKRKVEKDRLITTFSSNILEGFKGVKGDKK